MTSENLKTIHSNSENVSEAFGQDPYLGYSTLDEAINDCKASSQTEILARLLNHENLFISGPAGSGKSSVIKPFVNLLMHEAPEVNVAITAYTGVAATLIDGVTLHSWSGVDMPDPKFVGLKHIENRKTVDVLIIDEVSMVPAHFFESLDHTLRKAKGNDDPFGGIQLVLLGDFMQLPPVPSKGKDTEFCILSESWKNANIKLCYLDKVHRARDQRLQSVLNAISRDKVDDSIEELLNTRVNAKPQANKRYVNLFTTNRKIDDYNEKELAKIQSPEKIYDVIPHFDYGQSSQKKVNEHIRNADLKPLTLKVGAPVILTRNTYMGETLIPNGAIGEVKELQRNSVIVDFNSHGVNRICRTYDSIKEKQLYIDRKGKKHSVDVEIGSVEHLPLKIGFAISVHKSQGSVYDGIVADLSNAFMPGLGYVALSRVRDLDDLIITGLGDKALQVNQRSLRISQIVKKGALKNRRKFIEEKSEYDEILTNRYARALVWMGLGSGVDTSTSETFESMKF